MDEVVIKVENVSKDFLLPHEKVNTIKSVVIPAGLPDDGRGRGERVVRPALQDRRFHVGQREHGDALDDMCSFSFVRTSGVIGRVVAERVVTAGRSGGLPSMPSVRGPRLTGAFSWSISGQQRALVCVRGRQLSVGGAWSRACGGVTMARLLPPGTSVRVS